MEFLFIFAIRLPHSADDFLYPLSMYRARRVNCDVYKA